jgi:hypothetical protein
MSLIRLTTGTEVRPRHPECNRIGVQPAALSRSRALNALARRRAEEIDTCARRERPHRPKVTSATKATQGARATRATSATTSATTSPTSDDEHDEHGERDDLSDLSDLSYLSDLSDLSETGDPRGGLQTPSDGEDGLQEASDCMRGR